MRDSRRRSTIPFLAVPLFLLLARPASASSGSDYDYGAHPRFVCTPLPVDADPACFPTAGPVGGGAGHPNIPPAGWWGASEEAKATILHLRESLVQQKETILDQRETIRELTAKLTLCEGFGRTPHDDHRHHHAAVPPPSPGAHRPGYHARGGGGGGGGGNGNDNGHYGNQPGHHGNSNLIPDSPHHGPAGGPRSDGGHSNGGAPEKDKHAGGASDITSSPEQMERMLQALKERLDNLQKRNTSIAYSGSLKELLQRKINALEEQLHHRTAAHSAPDHHHDDSGHRDDDGGDHHDDQGGDGGGDHDRHDDHDHDHDHKDEHDSHGDGLRHDDGDGGHGGHDDHDDGHHEDPDHHDGDDDDDDDDHHGNEADSHSYLPHMGYRGAGPRGGFHSNKLETMFNQLHLAGSGRKKLKSPDAFQISFPMRTNYMYGRMKRTLLQEIFALTLCLWLKAGVGPGLGTPFSYSAPGQSNELVLIEWGNNPMELLIDDKAVTLPLSLTDGKWHHVCVTWSTRDGHWEAYQDGVQRGSGMNLSPWHPIKPGGVFILGQEQDTLGGRFDATQSFVGEMSDVQMWSHVLSSSDVYSLASCGSHLKGDVISWSESEVELHGGVSRYPFEACH